MIRIIAVGRIKEGFVKEGVAEYLKRLRRFAAVEVVEVRDSLMEKEAVKILDALGADHAVALAVEGTGFTSEELAEYFKKNRGKRMSFVIGGPEGLSEKVLERADMRLSLSPMTLTHEMARLVLAEQIYRAFTVIAGMKYHK
ncbi:MAG: 23S rRNA (pseudouridine(1915)-N(3))-methyltransferase RlmH [Candidatus Altiarchaeota archaeon]|nr:23S rRNA (pseudouridine(1915)-N(3))-methyltransferase RlmH [Candidatus Altiarchaeota archaeon]